ncbi:MAG: pirin family protein, partial [Actinomycetota bacterium]|nr:pirin family protein [Actinomycetota bacterium]
MIDIRAAAGRATTSQPGIVTRHCFSSGSHYDPDNVCFGPLIAVDEHTVEPGMGFASHRHRGVQILSWVLAGDLSHRDAQAATTVLPGSVLLQRAGPGIEHSERNAREDVA